MALLTLFKLEKLKIEAYKDAGRGLADLVGSMEVMFNPTSREESHVIKYDDAPVLNAGAKPAKYTWTPPGSFSMKLIFDGTGVNFIGAEQIAREIMGESVTKDIERFKDLCFKMNGD